MTNPCSFCNYPTPGPMHSCGSRRVGSRIKNKENRRNQLAQRERGKIAFQRFQEQMALLREARSSAPVDSIKGLATVNILARLKSIFRKRGQLSQKGNS